jgi:hypothetical protein
MYVGYAIDEIAQVLLPEFKEAALKKGFRVFVLGPFCRSDEDVPQPKNVINTDGDIVPHAKYLRARIKGELEGLGFTVDFGETCGILEAWQTAYKGGNLASSEMDHAEDHCKAIVIIPASVGSICELALFAPERHLSEKTVAIIHKKYENDKSFFIDGIVKLLDDEKGKVRFVDYGEHDKCVEAALKFVNSEWGSFRRRFREYLRAKQWGQNNAKIIEAGQPNVGTI